MDTSPETEAPPVSRASAYYELTKPGIAGYVMVTAGVSYHVAAGGSPDFLPLIHTILGTAAATAGALALNQYLERRLDARMERTRSRPLPSGRLAPGEALVFGAALLVAGIGYLWTAVGLIPASIAALSGAIYTLVYTPLKTRSYLATLVGAIPGALPVVIGWTAASGSLTLGGLSLFAVAFLWQLPHVLAIGWLLRRDYARAGFLLVPPTDPGGQRLGWHMVLYALALIPVSLFPTFLGLTGTVYLVGALILGILYLAPCLFAVRTLDRTTARKVFFASLAYLPLLLILLLVDTVPR